MSNYYTSEKNTQILIQLMKEHGIKKIIASPGSTNICFVASVQQDAFFQLYSCVDERSAAYMACGLSAETGEPVALSCTGATASRNYMPGLTESYYRHLPILAITSTQSIERVHQNIPQVVDRRVLPNDIANLSVHLPAVHDSESEWSCVVKVNNALLALKRNGGGPVHIDLTTEYSTDFSIKELPAVQKIERIQVDDDFPQITFSRVAVFVGAHEKWTKELTKAVDDFCAANNAVVLCDHTSNYWGKYRVLPNALCSQRLYSSKCTKVELLIHIGEISGSYMAINPKSVWRVHPDGELRDTFKALKYVFEMDELTFFKKYTNANYKNNTYLNEWIEENNKIISKIPDLPFSNVWTAHELAPIIPKGSVIHFGILNSLRSWNYFELQHGINGFCNVGGFGIDGGVSSLVGASLADENKFYFGIIGDLAFFYDMNALGNRHIGNNLRLMVVNNGRGSEFRNSISWASMFGEKVDKYIAAAGHFADMSPCLIKHYAEDLGFEYLSASNKTEFKNIKKHFVQSQKTDKPILLEIFTQPEDESRSLELMTTILKSGNLSAKEIVKDILGPKVTNAIKKYRIDN